MRQRIVLIILVLCFLHSGCATYNKPLKAWVSRDLKTKRPEAWTVPPVPEGDLLMISLKYHPTHEAGLVWKLPIFAHGDFNLRHPLGFAYLWDADGDGTLEGFISTEFEGHLGFLPSHDVLLFFNLDGEIRLRDKSNNVIALTPELLKEHSIEINEKNCLLLRKGTPLYEEAIWHWEDARKKWGDPRKHFNEDEVKSITKTDFSFWHWVGYLTANVSSIFGIWKPVLWSEDWFRSLRTGDEVNYLITNLRTGPSNSVYGWAQASRYDVRDVDNAMAPKPGKGYFNLLYESRAQINEGKR